MPLNEIPKYLNSETRRLVDFALEDAWRELRNDACVHAKSRTNEIGDDNRGPRICR